MEWDICKMSSSCDQSDDLTFAKMIRLYIEVTRLTLSVLDMDGLMVRNGGPLIRWGTALYSHKAANHPVSKLCHD